MSALDCSWRKSAICHVLINRLDVPRPDCHDQLLTQRWADVFCEQTLVAFIRLAADPRFHCLEPLIEVLIQPNLRAVSLDLGSEFVDLLSEKLLGLAQRAMNSTVVVTALL